MNCKIVTAPEKKLDLFTNRTGIPMLMPYSANTGRMPVVRSLPEPKKSISLVKEMQDYRNDVNDAVRNSLSILEYAKIQGEELDLVKAKEILEAVEKRLADFNDKYN